MADTFKDGLTFISETTTKHDGSVNVVTRSENVGRVYYDQRRRPENVVSYKNAWQWRQPKPFSGRYYNWRSWHGQCSVLQAVPGFDTTFTEFGPYPASSLTSLPVFPDSDPSPDYSTLIRRAEVECLLKIKGQKVNLGVAMATAKQSVELITTSVTRLTRALRDVKRGRWRSVSKSLGIPNHRFKSGTKDVSNRWLELQYGWLPLVQDAYGAYESMRQGYIRNSFHLHASRTLTDKFSDKYDYGQYPTFEVSEFGTFGAKVRLDYILRSDALSAAANLGLTNPAVIAWELVPWSFLIDWFVPIGDFLDALDADAGLQFLGGSRTTFCRFTRVGLTNETRVYNPGYASYEYKWNLQGDYNVFLWTRVTYDSSPIPTLYFKSPVSVGHALNAMALLRGLLK